MTTEAVETIRQDLASGLVIPYLGAGVLALAGENCPLPASPEVLVDRLTAKASVPHKIRKNLKAAAQFIENFKHRKTVVKAMTEAFAADVQPTALHQHLASIPALKLLVHAWYDDLRRRRWPAASAGAWCRGSVSPSISAPGRTPLRETVKARGGTQLKHPGCRFSISRWGLYRLPRTSLFRTQTLWRC